MPLVVAVTLASKWVASACAVSIAAWSSSPASRPIVLISRAR